MKSGVPPWHMWGSAAQTELRTQGGALNAAFTSTQLANIQYVRPDTWTFLLFAQYDANDGDGNLLISWDIQLGVGRATFPMKNFVQITFANNQLIGSQFWASTVLEPARNAADTVNRFITRFPAQSIQCTARLSSASTNPSSIKATVGAFFAPETHVRPEWFLREFPGDEHKGR